MSDLSQKDLTCSVAEPRLNQYVDGELDADLQSALFEHLSDCSACRQTFEAILAFRRMSRRERLAVPPAADESFMEALSDQGQQEAEHTSRRRPFWRKRASVSVRTALVATLVVFLTGLVLPSRTANPEPKPKVVVQRSSPTPPVIQPAPTSTPIFVFYPGLTVKASRVKEIPAKDPF